MALTDVQTRRAGLSASAELLVISSTDTVHERRPQKLWNRQSSSASFKFFFQFDHSGTIIWWQCVVHINETPTASHRFSLFYWNTTTDRLAPKTVIVKISQWQSVLHRSISLSCYISEKNYLWHNFVA